MTTYFYQATDETGKIIEGDIEAPDYRIAVQKVRGLNYYPIRVSEDQPNQSVFRDWSDTANRALSSSQVTSQELLLYTQQLATLISSKLTLDKSLTIAVRLTERERTRALFQDVQKRVHAGSSFADALAAYPAVFSKIHVNMIRAGELGGVLDTVLNRLADFLENAEAIKGKIINAMIYPAVLLTFGSGAILFLLTYVVPTLSEVFAGHEAMIPWNTQILLSVSHFFNQYGLELGVGLVSGFFMFFLFIKSEAGKMQWDRLALKLPVLGDLVRKIEMSRFSRTLASLLNSNVPVLQSLDIVHSVINNRAIAAALTPLKEGLKSGQGLSRPLQKTNAFPPLGVHMIVVGEESGELESMMIKVADTYDREVDNAIQRAIQIFGPAFVLLIGGSLIFIVVSVLMGMMEVTNVIF